MTEFGQPLSAGVLLWRIAVAVIIGAIIGIDREIKNRPAGMRTHVLVCVGAALVSLIELRLARGMCGKSYVLLTGDVATVTAAIERAETVASEDGMLLDSSVIPNPDKRLWDSIL